MPRHWQEMIPTALLETGIPGAEGGIGVISCQSGCARQLPAVCYSIGSEPAPRDERHSTVRAFALHLSHD